MKHLLLLVPLLTISFPCIAVDAAELVCDMENHEVTSEESYYVLPAEHGTGGGLRMLHTQRRCNYLASQASSEADNGVAVNFKPFNDSSDGKILLSSNVKITFSIVTQCIESMLWHVNDSPPFPSSELRQYVAVGKDEDRKYPMPLSQEFVFRIERYNGTKKGYKLVSCAGKGPCKDLGLHASKDKTWLGISDSPFVVVLKKGHVYA